MGVVRSLAHHFDLGGCIGSPGSCRLGALDMDARRFSHLHFQATLNGILEMGLGCMISV